MSLEFKTSEISAGEFPATLLEFQITSESGTIEPSVLKDLDIPDVDGSKGVVVSGRGPVWLFAHLLHHLHVTRWSATFDPRQGAVVTARHHPEAPAAGSVLEVKKSASSTGCRTP